MEKIRVAVVFGGVSPEYEVSLKSAYSVINAINKDKYDIIMLGITKDGLWFRYIGDVNDIPTDKWIENKSDLIKAFISPERNTGIVQIEKADITIIPVDIVFPVLHGKNGEDGTIQGLCELADIALVGSGAAASALCMDKYRAQKLVALEGINVTKAVCFDRIPAYDQLLTEIESLELPLFVKPVKAGSSIGVTMTNDISELPEAMKLAFMYDDIVIIEQGIKGKECGCSIIGNEMLITGRVNEIEVSHGFFNYKEKYTLETSKIIVPARIDASTEKRIQETGKAVYRILGCKGYARMDMFLTNSGDVVFNEANTIPGFTPVSQFPGMMRAAGMEYSEVVERLINLGLERKRYS